MAKQLTLHNALPIVAAAYGEKFGVKVEIGSNEAYTDGQTIVVPNIPEDYPHKDALWGYLAHEAAHIRFSDFNVEYESELHTRMSNALEDSRIERAMIAIYPGVSYTLNETTRYMVYAGHYAHVKQEHHPAAIVLGYCLYWLQTKLVGQTLLEEYLDKAKAVLESTFSPDIIVQLNDLLGQAPSLQSTEEAAALASQIINIFQKEKEAQEKKEQQEERQDQGQSQDQSQAGQSITQLLHELLNPRSEDLGEDAYTQMKNKLNQIAQDKENIGYLTVPKAIPAEDHPVHSKQLLSDVKKLTSKIRAQLYGLVQASQRVNTRHQHSGRRVDAHRLHRIVTGHTRVFITAKRQQRPNTAVHLLVDMSDSMLLSDAANGKPYYIIAREAALALALALENISGVNPAVTYFANESFEPVYSVIEHGQQVQHHIGKFNFFPGGSTPMAEALWYAAYQLSQLREERKMVIVVTDGKPDNADACQTVLNLYKQSNVEVMGIGIETTAVTSLFDRHIVIQDANCLQQTLFKLMAQSLTSV